MPRTLFLVCLFLAGPVAFGHGGGLDECGGHHDHKQGGYHIHNVSDYCKCHPETEGCKSGEPPEESDEDTTESDEDAA